MRKAGNKRSATAKAVVFICGEAGGAYITKQQLQGSRFLQVTYHTPKIDIIDI